MAVLQSTVFYRLEIWLHDSVCPTHGNVLVVSVSWCWCINGWVPQTSSLIRHKNTHYKPYGCDVCHKQFTARSSLITHMFTHVTTKPYTCSLCQSGFTTHDSLKIHMWTHAGERPYTCDICTKAFNSAGVCHKQFTACSSLNARMISPCKICKLQLSWLAVQFMTKQSISSFINADLHALHGLQDRCHSIRSKRFGGCEYAFPHAVLLWSVTFRHVVSYVKRETRSQVSNVLHVDVSLIGD